MKLAVIPARGGSKRIPRKNIRPFCGKPMIAWSIDAALTSACFDRVVVSTDDEEIAGIARACGADVPFMRPAVLADDFAGTTAVIAHALRWMKDRGHCFDLACCIYATAPFIDIRDIRQGLTLLQTGTCDFAFAVTTYPSPIERALRVDGNGNVRMLRPECFPMRSQDLEPAYHDAAQFYWGRTEAWLSGMPVFGETSAAVLLPRYRVQDIDTEEDWVRAELMWRASHAP